MLKKYAYVLYAWLTTFAFAGVIYWIALIPNFSVSYDLTNEVLKALFKMLLYSFLFLLLYRSLIATFRTTIQRLSHWRSKSEAVEDAEFVLIIETLLVVIAVLCCILFAGFEEYLQSGVGGRSGEIKDVLISTMSVLLTSLVVYSVPVLGELEVAIKSYYTRRSKQVNSAKKSKKK